MVSDKKIFKVYYMALQGKWAPPPGGHVFWDITMIWTNLVDNHLKTIYTKNNSNLTIGFREEDFQSFLYSYIRNIGKTSPAPGGHVFWDIIMIWTNLIEGPLKTTYTKYHSNLATGFGEEDFDIARQTTDDRRQTTDDRRQTTRRQTTDRVSLSLSLSLDPSDGTGSQLVQNKPFLSSCIH